MSYIGKEPANSFISFAKQDFTTSATTSYTLDNAVANENELALFINFVRQEPTTAYTASGTTLTLTSATASTDDMYCVYLGQAKQTVNAPDGSVGSSQVAASIITGQTAETSIADDDLILLSDTSASAALKKMTRANFVSGVGGVNTPAFYATRNNQSITEMSWSKVIFDTESFDTDSAFDTSTGRFTVPSGKAGKYFFSTTVGMDSMGANHFGYAEIKYYKNGSSINTMNSSLNLYNSYGAQASLTLPLIIDLSVGDYIEVYGYIEDVVDTTVKVNIACFNGYKIIE